MVEMVKRMPYPEDIYDMETEELQNVLNFINADMAMGAGCTLPEGIDSFEKYQRKVYKLKDSLELELEEREQVDNVISFFSDSTKNYLDDDAFYKLDDIAGAKKPDPFEEFKQHAMS